VEIEIWLIQMKLPYTIGLLQFGASDYFCYTDILSMKSLLAVQENVSCKGAESQRKKEAKKSLAPWRLCVRLAFFVLALSAWNCAIKWLMLFCCLFIGQLLYDWRLPPILFIA